MNRRDFLLFRTEAQRRLVELSCERLYMRYLDAQAMSGRRDAAEDCDPSQGEPPADLRTTGPAQLFADLERSLGSADVVRIVDRGWLAADDFRRDVERVIAAFRRNGGRVEWGTA